MSPSTPGKVPAAADDPGVVIGEDGLARPAWASVDPMLRDYYDTELVARYGDAEIDRLMADAGIVRNRAKILATITNAKATLKLRE